MDKLTEKNKLTASRLDIWPSIIKTVPDSIPLNLSAKSLFSVVLTLSCHLLKLYHFRKYCSQNYITVFFLNCLPSKHNLLWHYRTSYLSSYRRWTGTQSVLGKERLRRWSVEELEMQSEERSDHTDKLWSSRQGEQGYGHRRKEHEAWGSAERSGREDDWESSEKRNRLRMYMYTRE